MLQAANLAELDRVRHGFFTRAGGVSEGDFAALNCGYSGGDDPRRVEQNRALALAGLGAAPASLCTVRQVHGATVVVARIAEPGRPTRCADALVTDRPGLTLGVLSADCAPVLLADRAAGVIGAAHAGWRGALAGVLESTLAAMERLGASRDRIVAVLGPTIGPEAYEVGSDLMTRFTEADPANERFFRSNGRPGHARFDLPAYIGARLESAGVGEVVALGLCTYADEERFYSFRRATHRAEPDYGRLISAIALAPSGLAA